jgi:hypothetical protein
MGPVSRPSPELIDTLHLMQRRHALKEGRLHYRDVDRLTGLWVYTFTKLAESLGVRLRCRGETGRTFAMLRELEARFLWGQC